MLPIDSLTCDVHIPGAGGAGMLAALHVTNANPRARIAISTLWYVQPVHKLQPIDTREFASVARDESEIMHAADRGDLQVVWANGYPGDFKVVSNAGVRSRRIVVEGQRTKGGERLNYGCHAAIAITVFFRTVKQFGAHD